MAEVGGGGGWWWRRLVVAEVGGGGGWWWRRLVVAAERTWVAPGGHRDDPLSRLWNRHDEAMRQRTLGLLLVSVLAGGAGLAAPAVSSSQQSTLCGSARAASLTGLTSAGRVAWRTTLPHPQDSGTTAEIVAGGTVYADLSGAVTAVNESNGRIRWSRALGTDVYGEWLIGRTLVVDIDQVGPHAQVVGLNPTSGALDWRYRPGGNGLYRGSRPCRRRRPGDHRVPARTWLGRRRQRETALAPLDRLAGPARDRRDDSGGGLGQHHTRVRGGDGRPALDSGRNRQHGFAHPRRRRSRHRFPGDPRPDSDRRLRAGHRAAGLGTQSGRRVLAADGNDGRLGRRSGVPGGPRWPRPRRAGHGPHRLAVQHRSPSLLGKPSRRRRVQSRDGRATAPGRSVVRGPAQPDHRIARRPPPPRIQSGPSHPRRARTGPIRHWPVGRTARPNLASSSASASTV